MSLWAIEEKGKKERQIGAVKNEFKKKEIII